MNPDPKPILALSFPGDPISRVEIDEGFSFCIHGQITGLKQTLWERIKMAFKYWWLIASGRLEYAVLAKIKRKSS